MRLQISVQRHLLPTVNILWTARLAAPTAITAHSSAIISQLLEEINDIIPLESEGWGLEDYVVEVNGYECLHFQSIDSVLRDDDQVTIRALQTSDLRVRRLGGRYQIASDGRHLIDGVPFGKPYLRKAARPTIAIPPRKRRKLDVGPAQYPEDDSQALTLSAGNEVYVDGLTDDSDDDSDDDYDDDKTETDFAAGAPLQIAAKQGFEDADQVEEEDSEDYDSSAESGADLITANGMELSQELRALLRDDGSGTSHRDRGQLPRNIENTPVQQGKRKRDSDDDDHVDDATDEEEADEQDADGEETDFNGAPSFINDVEPSSGQSTSESESESDASSSSGIEDDNNVEELHTKSMEETIQSSHNDDIGTRDPESESPESESDVTSSSGSDSDDSDEELDAASIQKNVPNSDGDANSDESSSSSGESSHSESSSSSSSVESSFLSSSSSSESSEESDSEVESPPNLKLGLQHSVQPAISPSHRSSPKVLSRPAQSAPSQGSRRTKDNNRRQKRRKRLMSLKTQGLLPADANFDDMDRFDQAGVAVDGNLATSAQADLDIIGAKKQEILDKLNNQGHHEEAGLEFNETAIPSQAAEDVITVQKGISNKTSAADSPDPSSSTLATETVSKLNKKSDLVAEKISEPPRRRAKLDIASTRRMLFGSLGLRNPKTPAAEQELREKLAKQIIRNPSKPLPDSSAEKEAKEGCEPADQNSKWKTKITISAVECNYNGAEMKPPPFPFVQHWDQGTRSHSNSKNKLRNGRTYHDEDNGKTPDGPGPDQTTEHDSTMTEGVGQNSSIENYTTEGMFVTNGTSSTEKKEDIRSDGFQLLDDFSSLDNLERAETIPGAIIAYKELEMSKVNRWQPQMSNYRTARVKGLQEDGRLELVLSHRDRTPKSPPVYDKDTGKRIFSQFDIPQEDGSDEEDDGERQMSYTDLIEPKLVHAAIANPKSTESESDPTAAVPSPSVQKPETVTESAESKVPPDAQPHIALIEISEVEVATPQREKVSDFIKDAGFHSSLDSELRKPIGATLPVISSTSPGTDHESDHHSEPSSQASQESVKSAEPTGENEVELYSPQFGGFTSSPLFSNGHGFTGENTCEDQEQYSSSQQPAMAGTQNTVEYPRLSQVPLSASAADTSSHSVLQEAQRTDQIGRDNSSNNTAEVADTFGKVDEAEFDQNIERSDMGSNDEKMLEAEQTAFNSLKSTIPPSEDNAPESLGSLGTEIPAMSTFLGGFDGQASLRDSDDEDGLPSIAKLISPPPIRNMPSTTTGKRRQISSSPPELPSPRVDERTSSPPPVFKQSQNSEMQLSQIPAGSQIVDLTLSSGSIEADDSDNDYVWKSGRNKAGVVGGLGKSRGYRKSIGPLPANAGLGNRRLLKTKKTKISP